MKSHEKQASVLLENGFSNLSEKDEAALAHGLLQNLVTFAIKDAANGKVAMPAMDVMDVGRMAAIMDPAGAAFMVWQTNCSVGITKRFVGWSFLSLKIMPTSVPMMKVSAFDFPM